MYLKRLTLRGFKSFASATTMVFEPGITCIVGPNGSGKSNVVDALAWVMGEQGAKSLRGASMEDVIFAGTHGRSPLGRAEVVLTIDNSDGALPIDFREVTIARTKFRNGSSEYSINGTVCRLLDVRELLSDSGMGREMHVIVGQGQLDSILQATPEARRGFIEEAAGVLKHRDRKDKALRKLDATDANLARLADLVTEVGRQLKPLGRQAEVARKAGFIQAEAHDAKARLLADDVAQAQKALDQDVASEASTRQERDETERELTQTRAEEDRLLAAAEEAAPRLAAAQSQWYALQSLAEQVRSLTSLAQERIRQAEREPAEAEVAGRDPETLEAEAAAAAEAEERVRAEIAGHQSALAEATERRQAAEKAQSEAEAEYSSRLRAIADRREGLARLHGKVSSLTSRADQAAAQIERLSAGVTAAQERAEAADAEYAALSSTVPGLDDSEGDLDEAYEEVSNAVTTARGDVADLEKARQSDERDLAAVKARLEALEVAQEREGAGERIIEAGESLGGVVGPIASVITVDPGYETAIAALLGAADDAVVMASLADARDALTWLKSEDAGRAEFLVEIDDSSADPAGPPADPALDHVTAAAPVLAALRAVVGRAVVVDDLAAAHEIVTAHPGWTAVTKEGDILAPGFAAGGSHQRQSPIHIHAALAAAQAEMDAVTSRIDTGAEALQTVRAQLASARERLAELEARLNESDARQAAIAEQLNGLIQRASAARGEADRLSAQVAAAEKDRTEALAALEEARHRLEAAEAAGQDDGEPDRGACDSAAEAAKTSRAGEMEARLALRTAEERAKSLLGRSESLARAARQERAARARRQARRQQMIARANRASAILAAAQWVAGRIAESLAAAADARGEAEGAKARADEAGRQARDRARQLSARLDTLTEGVHREELLRSERRIRLENLVGRAHEEIGLDLDDLVRDYGPDQPIPAGEDEDGNPLTIPFVRAEQEKRFKRAERELRLLGKINPLALEEFEAMRERHRFLTEQLDDIKRTRSDLLDIVKEVDARVEEVFSAAYEDVEREFAYTFTRLFPGGEGRLVLTEPGNWLTTGIDVEARPAGKKVKRLSLLSGGERSLVAVCFLIALFRARPSPFYILDEVEAALDDTNVGRLLDVYTELRETSQLLVITHQKRTMEIADVLYGVSMRGDGVSTVVSQRLRDD
ncbi:MAG: chromosome segregation protein SMC [Propionibacteriaceae bacterium]|jgi:chromosome segregation protein|nr:chromosome segregation protein SMC [Propionibacteriaceae bacterium]